MAMTREEAMVKLLAIEPEPRERIVMLTGWPPEDTEEILARLVADGVVRTTNWPTGGWNRRLYFVPKPAAPQRKPSRLVHVAEVAQRERRLRREIASRTK